MGISAAMFLAGLQLVPAIPELGDADVRTVEVADDGAVWFGVRDRGLARFSDGELEWIPELPLQAVADLHVDENGVLWVVGVGGAAALTEADWLHFPDPGGLGSRVVFRITEEPRSGALWFAGTGGAARLLNDEWETVTERDGLPHSVVHAVLVTDAGARWFACRRGLARMDPQGLVTFEPTTNFRSILQAPDGAIWFGTSSGFRLWSGSELSTFGSAAVYPTLATTEGGLWAGSGTEGVFRYDGSEWEKLPTPVELRGGEVFDLAQDGSGVIWIATSKGVWTVNEAGAF
ncbi:MAG: two-component regulator propeller domain-containing protein [Longimicrobiales bacterium]